MEMSAKTESPENAGSERKDGERGNMGRQKSKSAQTNNLVWENLIPLTLQSLSSVIYLPFVCLVSQ